MKLLIFAVFDTKVAAFMPPFTMSTRGAALRGFGDEVARPGSEIGKHPEDYMLYEVGAFEQATGAVTAAVPECVCTAIQFVEPVAKPPMRLEA